LNSILKASALILALVLLVGCAGLQPFEGPTETTPPPVTKGVWADIERVRPANWQVPLNDGRTALDWRLRAIDSATQSIDLQSFLWSFDKVGSVVHERLLAAADRGVNVRILIDDSFLLGEDRHVLELHRHDNVQYRVYNPYKRRSTGSVSRFVLNLGEFHRLDHRMHNKSIVVDNQVAIIGGRNLADEYFGFDDSFNFRDMELLVGGPVVEDISGSFDQYWNDRWSFPIDAISHVRLSHTERESISGNAALLGAMFPPETERERNADWVAAARGAYTGSSRLIVDAPPAETPQSVDDRPVQVARELGRLISQARDEVTIVSAYLIPTPGLIDVLRDAVRRGVRVRLLTNSINSNNHLTAYTAYHGHVRELIGLGAEVHEMRVLAQTRSRYIFPPVARKSLGLHAKYMIIDGRRVVVGSANLDPRSLRINTEMVMVVDSQRLAQRLLNLTEPDFDTSNSWQLAIGDDGRTLWVGDNQVLDADPAQSGFQRLEEWFFAHLPIENEL
jgi:putative cardiolipin synthase